MPTARIYNVQREAERIVIGGHCVIRGELLTFGHGGRILIGDWCYIGEGTRIWSAKSITIGNRVLIAHNVNVFDNDTHPMDAGERHRHMQEIYFYGHPHSLDLEEKPVTIGDDVWIGAGAFVLKGVEIGSGAVVAAGSVVTRDIPPFSVVAGNPARVVRSLS